MSDLKDKALEKMLGEMNEKHSYAEDVIHNHLCNQSDDVLFSGILTKGKSINGAMLFVYQKAKEQSENNMAMISDDQVFSWVKDYFTKKDIKVEPIKQSVRVATSNAPAPESIQAVKPKAKPKKEHKSINDDQLNLFDYL